MKTRMISIMSLFMENQENLILTRINLFDQFQSALFENIKINLIPIFSNLAISFVLKRYFQTNLNPKTDLRGLENTTIMP